MEVLFMRPRRFRSGEGNLPTPRRLDSGIDNSTNGLLRVEIQMFAVVE